MGYLSGHPAIVKRNNNAFRVRTQTWLRDWVFLKWR